MPPLLGEEAMAQVQKWPWAISISTQGGKIMKGRRKRVTAVKGSHLKKARGKRHIKARGKKSAIKA